MMSKNTKMNDLRGKKLRLFDPVLLLTAGTGGAVYTTRCHIVGFYRSAETLVVVEDNEDGTCNLLSTETITAPPTSFVRL